MKKNTNKISVIRSSKHSFGIDGLNEATATSMILSAFTTMKEEYPDATNLKVEADFSKDNTYHIIGFEIETDEEYEARINGDTFSFSEEERRVCIEEMNKSFRGI